MIPISVPLLGSDEMTAVLDVLKSGKIVQGERVATFEQAFSEYVGGQYSAATSSGTTALQLAVEALNLKKGSEVITTPLSFIASSNALLFNHLRPVFADIRPETFTIDPDQIENQITDNTTAVLVVHLYGHPCDMKNIQKICKTNGLRLIEDCAQALGAAADGQRVGTFGDAACFSFYPSKNITTGEGGMVVTMHKEIADRIRLLRNHGQVSAYEHTLLGYNFRMTDLQAALGIVQLQKIDRLNDQRRRNAERLTEELQGLSLDTPALADRVTHAWQQYTIKTRQRDALLAFLRQNGIDARIYYPQLIYQQPVYRDRGMTGECPTAEEITGQILSLPVHPGLTEEDRTRIISVCRAFEAQI